MPQVIRIAIEVEQRTEPGVDISGYLWDENDNEAEIFLEKDAREPVSQPFTIHGGGTRIFTSEGGKYHGKFSWTASDGKERTFTQEIEIPIPPECPRCEQRVPELVDYLCANCRFG